MIGAALIMACAPHVAPATVREIIRVESRGDPLALHINGGKPVDAKTKAEAAAIAAAAIKHGRTVDIGLMQVNSATGARLGYTVAQLLDPCTNLHVGAMVLQRNYRKAKALHGPGQPALKAALSAYNTGNFTSGFRNGYVGRYYGEAETAALTASPYAASPTVYVNPSMQETHHESRNEAGSHRDP